MMPLASIDRIGAPQCSSVPSAPASSRAGSGRQLGHAPGDMAVGPHQHGAAHAHLDTIRRMARRQLLQPERHAGFAGYLAGPPPAMCRRADRRRR